MQNSASIYMSKYCLWEINVNMQVAYGSLALKGGANHNLVV